MVEQIVELGSELKLHPFPGQGEILEQGCILIVSPGRTVSVARKCALKRPVYGNLASERCVCQAMLWCRIQSNAFLSLGRPAHTALPVCRPPEPAMRNGEIGVHFFLGGDRANREASSFILPIVQKLPTLKWTVGLKLNPIRLADLNPLPNSPQ